MAAPIGLRDARTLRRRRCPPILVGGGRRARVSRSSRRSQGQRSTEDAPHPSRLPHGGRPRGVYRAPHACGHSTGSGEGCAVRRTAYRAPHGIATRTPRQLWDVANRRRSYPRPRSATSSPWLCARPSSALRRVSRTAPRRVVVLAPSHQLTSGAPPATGASREAARLVACTLTLASLAASRGRLFTTTRITIQSRHRSASATWFRARTARRPATTSRLRRWCCRLATFSAKRTTASTP